MKMVIATEERTEESKKNLKKKNKIQVSKETGVPASWESET